jgi:hypothetical protein
LVKTLSYWYMNNFEVPLEDGCITAILQVDCCCFSTFLSILH